MQTLVYVGLGNAAAAVAVAALAAAVARLGRRPALTHRAWLLVYLKLLAPPLLAVPVPWLFAAAVPAATRHEEVEEPGLLDVPAPLPPRTERLPAPPDE